MNWNIGEILEAKDKEVIEALKKMFPDWRPARRKRKEINYDREMKKKPKWKRPIGK